MGLYDFVTSMNESVRKDVVGSLLIALVALSAEFFSQYIYMFVGVMCGYIVFNKMIGLKEKRIDVHLAAEGLKADVIKKEENLRGQIILTKLRVIEQKSKIQAHATINKNLTPEELSEAYDKFDILCLETDDIMTKDVKVPYHEFMLNEENQKSAPLPTVEAVEAKFDKINVLEEKK